MCNCCIGLHDAVYCWLFVITSTLYTFILRMTVHMMITCSININLARGSSKNHTHTHWSAAARTLFTDCVCLFTEDVRGQPVHWPSDCPRFRPAALGCGWWSDLGGGTCPGCGLHHLYRHRYPALQKVSRTDEVHQKKLVKLQARETVRPDKVNAKTDLTEIEWIPVHHPVCLSLIKNSAAATDVYLRFQLCLWAGYVSKEQQQNRFLWNLLEYWVTSQETRD